ncbi:helix-turn-helix domain-containing protein [Neorhizobium huautlense]|uniref:helix-turn-helix domain-containing protein n=1 Tax=Neorhizobium huautlense TaxID=67774 RepID=UPI000CFA55C7|nr:helix-turn-helix transcriptional regulator [Neorhizobium huautlense]
MDREIRDLAAEEIIAGEDALMNYQFAVLDAMQEKSITKAELAKMLGVSRARVSQMLSSEANPTIKLVGRALHVLGLRADYVSASEVPREVEEVSHALDNEVDESCRWRALQRRQVDVIWHQNTGMSANSNGYKVAEAA